MGRIANQYQIVAPRAAGIELKIRRVLKVVRSGQSRQYRSELGPQIGCFVAPRIEAMTPGVVSIIPDAPEQSGQRRFSHCLEPHWQISHHDPRPDIALRECSRIDADIRYGRPDGTITK